MENERFEFETFVIDVITEVKEKQPMIEVGEIGLLFMEPDKGDGIHTVKCFHKYADYETLMVAQKGLELLMMAENRNEDEKI